MTDKTPNTPVHYIYVDFHTLIEIICHLSIISLNLATMRVSGRTDRRTDVVTDTHLGRLIVDICQSGGRPLILRGSRYLLLGLPAGSLSVHIARNPRPAPAGRFFLDERRVSLHRPVRMVASMGTTLTKCDAPT